jgi:hypothetical protein
MGMMLRLLSDDDDGGTDFTLDQLAGAFDRIRSPRDWKAPIRAEIAASDRAVVERAVSWFTATVAVFEPVPGRPDRLTICAAGYGIGPMGAPALVERLPSVPDESQAL